MPNSPVADITKKFIKSDLQNIGHSYTVSKMALPYKWQPLDANDSD